MKPLLAIAGREYASFFRLPIGWVVIALFLALAGFVFALGSLQPGEPATLQSFFNLVSWLMIFIAPAISMRLVSDELRSGAIEPLMTAPVSDWQVIAGKYAGGVAFLFTILAPTLVYALVLEWLADPDPGPILAGYLGVALMGMLYLAVGLLASTLTANQIVAFLGALFALLLVRMATVWGARFVEPPFTDALYALSVDLRVADFSRGVIDTSHIVFFLAASAWFIVLAVVALESRRWR